VHQILPEDAWELFEAMPGADQRHSLAVLGSISADGDEWRALAQAALLHDCAKYRGPFTLLHKVFVVLTCRHARGLDNHGGHGVSGGGWRKALWVHANHPRLGAEAAEAAGCDPLAVRLIVRHHEALPVGGEATLEHRLLAELQRADELS
jgi:hypothetical protein